MKLLMNGKRVNKVIIGATAAGVVSVCLMQRCVTVISVKLSNLTVHTTALSADGQSVS